MLVDRLHRDRRRDPRPDDLRPTTPSTATRCSRSSASTGSPPTARSSANRYHETFHDAGAWAPQPRNAVPTGVAVFPTDYSIRRFAERTGTIVHWSEFDRGGHFAAMEAPDLLVGDILLAFFRGLR